MFFFYYFLQSSKITCISLVFGRIAFKLYDMSQIFILLFYLKCLTIVGYMWVEMWIIELLKFGSIPPDTAGGTESGL